MKQCFLQEKSNQEHHPHPNFSRVSSNSPQDIYGQTNIKLDRQNSLINFSGTCWMIK